MDWNERYAEAEFAYGTEPNDFLRDVADRIPAGPVLCLAEGQGRNAVFLARQGHAVTAVDGSSVGMQRARELAAERGVAIDTHVADLADWAIAEGHWAGIVSIFAHVPPELRRRLHHDAVRGLAPGGVMVLEAYTPAQLALGTGGPSDVTRLMRAEELREDLAGLEFEILREVERDIHEGRHHGGRSAVVQVLARRGAA